jgi:type II secretory pathway predicted ATPase ExeA/septal ring-binding cell division protein DamX
VVLEALLYAIQSGEGILKVVGEVGSGKTMLCRMLEQRLPETVEVVYLANPKLTPHDILYAVAFELNLDVTQDTPRLVLMQKLQSHLLQQHAANRSVLVIIEEAQSMPLETLEEIRLFSNLETHQHKLMQIVLFGQPELDKNLQEKNIRQLKERITHSFYLNPLTPDEVSDYLRHRLQAAGCPAPQIFSKAAENLISKASGGLTRRINILADKAMLAAYSESATATRPRSLGNQLEPTVTVQHVKAAIHDSDYTPTRRISPLIAGFAAMLVIIGILVWQLIIARSAQSSTISSAVPVANPALRISDSSAAENVNAAAVPVPEQTAIQKQPPAGAASPTSATDSVNQPVDVGVLPGIVSARINEYQRLRQTGETGLYTVQVLYMNTDEIPFVESTLSLIDRSDLLDNTYVCLTQGQDRPLWRILFGQYATVQAARAAINRLPSELRAHQPFIQNVARLQCLTVRS